MLYCVKVNNFMHFKSGYLFDITNIDTKMGSNLVAFISDIGIRSPQVFVRIMLLN